MSEHPTGRSSARRTWGASAAIYSQRGIGFGTSGVRAPVDALTDEVCFTYTTAFLRSLVLSRATGEPTVALAHDLRPSSPCMTAACIVACRAADARVVLCGAIPTPALTHYAIQRALPAIMVTGSHIPFDRNGLKFYTSAGEILKTVRIHVLQALVDREQADDRSPIAREPEYACARSGGERISQRVRRHLMDG